MRTAPSLPGLRRGTRWSNFVDTWPAEPVAAYATAPEGAGEAWVREALALAEREDLRVRAHGSGWSFSRAAAAEGLLLDLRALRDVVLLDGEDLPAGRAPGELVLAGPGATLTAVCAFVEARGRSLPVTNGRGGLTLVGALATGSHGSAVDLPPLGDFLAGVALAVASDRVLWVEGARPAVSDAFLRARGWERVADDGLLAAAQVHHGCMGVVLAVAMELVPAFDLDHRWSRPPDGPALRAFVRAPASTSPPGFDEGPPYHANLVINAHRGDPRLSTGWRVASTSPPSVNSPAPGPVPPFGALLTPIPRACPAAVGPILNLLIAGAARPPRSRGPLGAIFPARVPVGYRPVSQEFALDLQHADEALDRVLAVLRARPDGFAHPGFVAVRWMVGTRAPLGFTRFARTITLELPTLHAPGVERTFDRLREALDDLGAVEHPGQVNAYDRARLAASFGDRLPTWRAARERLLGRAAWRFASAWSDQIGLT
jgi:hypothetical protein